MTSLLSSRVANLCGDAARDVAIRIVSETGSTNADLLAAVPQLEQATLLWAEQQTAGKGRAGRNWYSAAGATLTFSLAWRFALPLQALAGLPLAVGVALAEALATQAIAAQLKWPNDIVRDGRKLGGILIETKYDPRSGTSWAVIGVGINMNLPPLADTQLADTVATAPELQADREQTMALLLTALAAALTLFAQHGFSVFTARWNILHAHAGKTVNILDGESLLHSGTAIGVDDSGRLLLDTAGGRVAIVAGDVSLRAV